MAVPLAEMYARSDLHDDDRRDDKVHRHAKRGPPAGVGDEVSAVLPEILQPMADESDYEEPGRSGDCRGCHDNEGEGDAAFDTDDLPSAIGNRETDVYRGDRNQSQGIHGRAVKPPKRQWRCRLNDSDSHPPRDRRPNR